MREHHKDSDSGRSTMKEGVGDLGKLLRGFRLKSGKTIAVIAELSGLHPHRLWGLERGNKLGCKTVPPRDSMLSLANVLHLDETDTDRLLFAAGYSTLKNWLEDAEVAKAEVIKLKEADTVPSEPNIAGVTDIDPEYPFVRRSSNVYGKRDR